MHKLERITDFQKVITPFRPPQMDRVIRAFSDEIYFYHDQSGSPKFRFEVWDTFLEQFYSWSGFFQLKDYYSYSVAGATEAIIWCIYDLKFRGGRLVVLENEYSFYSYVAEKIGLSFKKIKSADDLIEGDTLIMSSPFCRTGQVDCHTDIIKRAEVLNLELWLDIVYLGTTKKQKFHIPENTLNVFFSCSKQFGLGLNRIGAWFSRRAIPERDIIMKYGYYSVGSIALATKLMETFPVDWLYKNYREHQLRLTSTPSEIIYMCLEKGCLTQKLIDGDKN